MEGGGNIQSKEGGSSTTSTTKQESGRQQDDSEQGSSYFCCHPAGLTQRFLALFFMCLLGFGSYFCYDNPAALMDYFHNVLNLNTKQFTMLYSFYSWPNVVLCFIGGFLIDRVFGVRLGTTIYMLVTLIGQLIFATGVYYSSFITMILGRLVFGIGCESLAVAQNSYAVLWFKGKELNMVFGLQLSFARVGSAVNFWVMEPIYLWVHQTYTGSEGLGVVIYIASLTCLVSMICALILGCLDKRAERILRRNENSSGQLVQFGDIKSFPITFWMICVVCVAYYVAIFPFIALGKNFFIKKFHMGPIEANRVNSIVYLISAFASPALGLLVDKLGKNVSFVVMAIITTIWAHLILNFCEWNPYYGMSLMGLSYSLLASSLWPLVALIIPEYQLGTAYGICQAVQNLGLAVIPMLAGVIVDDGGYFWVEIFFISCLVVALFGTIVMWALDIGRGGILNMTPGQRKLYHQSLLPSEVLNEGTDPGSVSHNDTESLVPNSDFQIRNRYLSRIGAPLPAHYSTITKGCAYRALR